MEENEKTLKDYIENRVANLTRKPKSPIRRVVLFLFDNSKINADIIDCLDDKNNGMDYVGFDDEKDVVSALQEQIDIYKTKIVNRELYCPEGIYVLIATSIDQSYNDTIIQNIQCLLQTVFNKVLIEFCVLKNSEDELAFFESDNPNGNMTPIWIVENSLPSTLRFLLENARYAKETLGEQVRNDMKTNPLVLQLDESNAIRQEISETFLKAIRKKTEPRDVSEIRKDILDYLFTKEYRRQLIKQVPSIDWLPILGYEKLTKRLGREIQSLSFGEKFLRRFNPQSIESKLTIGEVLDILFVSMGNQTRTESIRQSIHEVVIPNICSTFLETVKTDVTRTILQRFSIHDIVYELRNQLLTLKEEVQQDIAKTDEEIGKILDANFSYLNTELDSIYFGLGEYISEFENQCKNYVCYTWWESMASFVSECQEIAKANEKEYMQAETVFMLSMIDEQVTMSTNPALNITISDYNDVINKLNHYSTNASLTLENLLTVIKIKDKQYSKTSDYHVNKDEQPHIYMFVPSKFSGDIEKLDEAKSLLDLSWDFILEDYIPSQLSYQIKVYKWTKGGYTGV